MDERQQQIQVGAGLQESRLNTDLIAWLEKYGTWILTLVLVVVLAYVGWTRLKQHQTEKLDEAFAAYTAARGTFGTDGVLTGSPDNLLKVAQDHPSRKSIAELARLDAAEIYLGSARRGLRPGADIVTIKPEDALSADEAAQLLTKAGELFSQVAAKTAGNDDVIIINLRARLGQAITALSQGEREKARSLFTAMEADATRAGFAELAEEFKRRNARIDSLPGSATLLTDADLPPLPAPTPASAVVPSNNNIIVPPMFRDEQGNPIELQRMPDGFVPPGAGPAVTPPAQPQPAPAPAPEAETPPAEQPKTP